MGGQEDSRRTRKRAGDPITTANPIAVRVVRRQTSGGLTSQSERSHGVWAMRIAVSVCVCVRVWCANPGWAVRMRSRHLISRPQVASRSQQPAANSQLRPLCLLAAAATSAFAIGSQVCPPACSHTPNASLAARNCTRSLQAPSSLCSAGQWPQPARLTAMGQCRDDQCCQWLTTGRECLHLLFAATQSVNQVSSAAATEQSAVELQLQRAMAMFRQGLVIWAMSP